MSEIRHCICYLCEIVFHSDRPFADVVAEADELFPGSDVNDPEDMACLCEECFIKVAEFYNIPNFTKYIDKN